MKPCTPPELAEIARLEHLAFAAWPAEEVVAVEGWRLRAMRGVTRRANSVFTCGKVLDPGAATLSAEAEYRPVIMSVPAGPLVPMHTPMLPATARV